jgi:hypothetical protein
MILKISLFVRIENFLALWRHSGWLRKSALYREGAPVRASNTLAYFEGPHRPPEGQHGCQKDSKAAGRQKDSKAVRRTARLSEGQQGRQKDSKGAEASSLPEVCSGSAVVDKRRKMEYTE